jgi:hypothetical protein
MEQAPLSDAWRISVMMLGGHVCMGAPPICPQQLSRPRSGSPRRNPSACRPHRYECNVSRMTLRLHPSSNAPNAAGQAGETGGHQAALKPNQIRQRLAADAAMAPQPAGGLHLRAGGVGEIEHVCQLHALFRSCARSSGRGLALGPTSWSSSCRFCYPGSGGKRRAGSARALRSVVPIRDGVSSNS